MLLICTLLGASSGLQPESPWHSQSGQVSSRGPGPYGSFPSYFPHASHPAPPLPSAPLLAGSPLRTCTYPFLPPHSLRSPHDATSPGGLPWPHCTESHKPVHTHVPPCTVHLITAASWWEGRGGQVLKSSRHSPC